MIIANEALRASLAIVNCSGVERIPEHIRVSSLVDSLTFEKCLVFPREELR